MDKTDTVVIVSSLIAVCLTLIHPIDIYLIFLTHLFVIPSYYIVKNDMWLCCFLSFSVFASLLWHFSKEDFYNEQFEKFDIVHQNLLVAISICLILYESIPQFILGVLFVYTIFLSIFGLNTIDGIPLYEIMTAAWVIPLFIHVPWIDKSKRLFLAILILYSSVAVATFLIANGENYNMIHSIWHICAYCSLYFAFRIANWKRKDFRMNYEQLQVPEDN